MSEFSGFFDAHKVSGNWDRTYVAAEFARYFASFVGNGVFAGQSNELQALQSTPQGMSITVAPGKAWIEGYMYYNDANLVLSVDNADGALNRIDTVVCRWSATDRMIKTYIKKGTAAVSPVTPTVQWDADVKELQLAYINISAGATAIAQSMIVDTRANNSVCGWVTGIIDQVDTTTLFLQWQDAYTKYFDEQKAAWDAFFDSVQSDLGIPIPSVDTKDFTLVVNPQGDGYVLTDKPRVSTPTEETNATNKKYVDDKRKTFTATLSATWVGSAAPYTQNVSISEVLATDAPHVTPDYSTTLATALAQREAWSMVSYAEAVAGGIKFTCLEDKPAVAIPIQIEVMR